VLVALAGFVMAVDYIADGQLSNINQAVIRAAYLVVTGTSLAYASAHREHEKGRLAKLAHWPAAEPAGKGSGPWRRRCDKQPACSMPPARSSSGKRTTTGPEPRFGRPVNARLSRTDQLSHCGGGTRTGKADIFAHGPDFHRLNLINGSVRFIPDVLHGELVSRLRITDFSSSPLKDWPQKAGSSF